MEIESLKYTEILKQNALLNAQIQGETYKVKLLSNVTISGIKEIFEYSLRIAGINPSVEIGNFDNIVQESYTTADSALVVVFYDSLGISNGILTFLEDMNDSDVNNLLATVKNDIDTILNNLKLCPSVIFNTFSDKYFVSNEFTFSKAEKFVFELNQYLFSKDLINVKILNIDKIISRLGVKQAVDLRLFNSSKAPYSLHFFKMYVVAAQSIVLKSTGRVKKVLVFDCDNTLWKGIIGEDGIDNIDMSQLSMYGRSFNIVQQIAVYLRKNGVLIALCSKNNEADVTEVIQHHKDMILREKDIVAQKINWLDKATNLKAIASELNLSLDALVFVDDSSFEVDLVKSQIPEITVLKVPDAIYEYPGFLFNQALKLFNLSTTAEDALRTDSYKQQIKREDLRNNYSSIEDYLKSLKISISISENERMSIPRVAQLTQKTNQFNLTTKRLSETEVQNFITKGSGHVFSFNVSDKFGDSGLTGVFFLSRVPDNANTAMIENVLLSCRIIGRNIEYAALNYILDWLQNNNYQEVVSQFIPTKKNAIVANFFESAGFELKSSSNGIKNYYLKITDYAPKSLEYIGITAALKIEA